MIVGVGRLPVVGSELTSWLPCSRPRAPAAWLILRWLRLCVGVLDICGRALVVAVADDVARRLDLDSPLAASPRLLYVDGVRRFDDQLEHCNRIRGKASKPKRPTHPSHTSNFQSNPVGDRSLVRLRVMRWLD